MQCALARRLTAARSVARVSDEGRWSRQPLPGWHACLAGSVAGLTRARLRRATQRCQQRQGCRQCDAVAVTVVSALESGGEGSVAATAHVRRSLLHSAQTRVPCWPPVPWPAWTAAAARRCVQRSTAVVQLQYLLAGQRSDCGQSAVRPPRASGTRRVAALLGMRALSLRSFATR